MSETNMWGTDPALIDEEEFCVGCEHSTIEQDDGSRHYEGCPVQARRRAEHAAAVAAARAAVPEEQRYIAALTAAGWTLPDPLNTRTLVALYVRLQDGKPEPVSPANDTTIDGVPVTLGMRVWDYDLRPVTVVEVEHLDPHTGAWWYRCQRTAGQGPGHMFDAKRMWHRHPSTGRTAP